jgi:hypothetical protein
MRIEEDGDQLSISIAWEPNRKVVIIMLLIALSINELTACLTKRYPCVGRNYSLKIMTSRLLSGATPWPPPSGVEINICSPIQDSTTASPVLVCAGSNAVGYGFIIRMEI